MTETSSKRAFLFRFKFGGNAGFIVEFGHLYIRLFANHGQLISGSAPYELVSPFTMDDLWNSELECCKLQFVQNGDILYLLHPKYMKKLVRLSNNNWELQDWSLKGGPWEAVNVSDVRITSSASTGNVTLSADGNVFSEEDVGRLIRLTLVNDNTKAWQANESVSANDIWTSDGHYYKAINAGTTGNVKPVHTEGTRSDGTINWEYLHSGYGTAEVTAYTSNTQVSATVIDRMPDGISTSHWEKGLIIPGKNCPMSGCFFKNRFWLLVDTDSGLQAVGSCSGDFNNFADKEFGEVTAESAISIPVNSKEYNLGRWIASGDALFVGTSSGEFSIDAANSNQAMAADNVTIKQISSIGSKPIMPITINGHIMFVDRFGVSVRDLVYSYERDGYDPMDASILGKHLLKSGIVAWDWQDVPNKLLWLVMGDGRVVVFTFDAQQQVAAFSQHWLSGPVESLAVIPSPDERRDDVWVIVKRKIGNTIKRYVEWIDEGTKTEYSDEIEAIVDYEDRKEAEEDFVRDNAFFVDSGLIYNRVAGDTQTTLSGLGHLAGCEVAIAANGQERPHQVVSAEGSITIKETDTKVVVGLPVQSVLNPQIVYLGSDNGHGMAEVQRIDHLNLMLYRSGGGQAGSKQSDLIDILYHSGNEIFGKDVRLFTGTVSVQWPAGTSLLKESGANIQIVNSSIYPMHILAVVPAMESSR